MRWPAGRWWPTIASRRAIACSSTAGRAARWPSADCGTSNWSMSRAGPGGSVAVRSSRFSMHRGQVPRREPKMSDELCPVELRGLGEDRLQFEFVLLVDKRGRRLPIWIGKCEAIAIQLKLQGLGVARPMTHDLLCNSVERLGGRGTRLLIDDIWQKVFYAKLCLEVEGSAEEVQVDCRPSDG